MEYRITLGGHAISYFLKTSTRAKRVSATMYPDGRLVVSVPTTLGERDAASFLTHAEKWVVKQIESHKHTDAILIPHHRKKQRSMYMEHARVYISRILHEHNLVYGFEIGTVRIKDLKSQWGSASVKKNLNFNYKIIFLPPHIARYVVAHELCHLGEMNHSKAFWRLLEQTTPNPRQIDKELGRYHLV